MNESTTFGELEFPNLSTNTYNDFTGFMGNDFPAITGKPGVWSDDILKRLLDRLEREGKYSKDIQNITIDDKYRKEINSWKKWLVYNIKHRKELDKSFDFRYINIFPEIEKMRREEMTESLLKKIDIFINEEFSINQVSNVFGYIKTMTADINKFRKKIGPFIKNEEAFDATWKDTNTLFSVLDDPRGPFWKKGSKVSALYAAIFDARDKMDQKAFSNLTDATRNLKARLGYFVDKINAVGDQDLIDMCAKDFKEWKKAIKDKKSIFWTKNGDVTFMWGNVIDYVQKNSK